MKSVRGLLDAVDHSNLAASTDSAAPASLTVVGDLPSEMSELGLARVFAGFPSLFGARIMVSSDAVLGCVSSMQG